MGVAFFKPIHAAGVRIGSPSVNYDPFTPKPSSHHVHSTLRQTHVQVHSMNRPKVHYRVKQQQPYSQAPPSFSSLAYLLKWEAGRGLGTALSTQKEYCGSHEKLVLELTWVPGLVHPT